MRKGIVIGKFMPLHKGHTALIDFALKHCNNLIVLVGTKEDEPVSGKMRLHWLTETYQYNSRVIIEYTDEDLPDSSYSSKSVSKVWADYLIKRFPDISVIYSSEKYGDYLAGYMGIEHKCFDLERKHFPVSATDIRNEPFKHWDFITESVRPYYVKKVCVYGPESTGKSILTEKLAEHFNTDYVPEMARDILGSRHVVYDDISVIARVHALEILKKEEAANKILFCDTDLTTTKIYSEHYFNKVPDFPLWIENANKYALYLFCDIDVPWINDSQRDSPHLREEHKAWFLKELKNNGTSFYLINGTWENRFIKACYAVKSIYK